MSQVTKKQLGVAIELLNAQTNKVFELEYAYGGVKLVERVGDKGGIRDITMRYSTKRELMKIISSMYLGLTKI